MSDIILTEQSAPASPGAATHAVYVDSTTKKLATKDSAGTVVDYGTGGDITLALTHAASSKTPPVDADELPLLDSATSFSLKRLTWANIKAALNSVYMAYVAPGAVDGHVLTAASGAWTSAAPASGGGGDKYPMEARLTLETGVAVSTTDQTAKTSVYLTPYMGNQIATYSGTAWSALPLSADISLSLSGYTADKNYDIWVYNNSGTLTLDSTIWTNDTTRATALALQDGVYCKTGALTRRYVGTIRITATTGQCEDSLVKRFVWNNYNGVDRLLFVRENTSHVYGGASGWRLWNNSSINNKLEFVNGLATLATVTCWYGFINTGATYRSVTEIRVDGVTSQEIKVSFYYVVGEFQDGASKPLSLEAGYHYGEGWEYAAVGNVSFMIQNLSITARL